MSERGVFAVDRGLFDHPMFAHEPFTEREAWIWLIKEAAWKDRTARVGSAVVKLKRGQCAHSIRFMADIWQWHRSKVERFVNRLKIETLIGTHTETGVTVITVCKYDEYQRVSLPRETATETVTATEPRQQRDKPEDIKNIEDKKDIGAIAPDANVLKFDAKPKYVFTGAVLQVTAQTWDDWKENYPCIPDLHATVATIDAWFVDNPLKPGEKWFFRACRWLQKENGDAKAASREARRGVDWM